MKKTKYFIFLGMLLVATIFFAHFSSSEVTYCCEKTVDGAYCQNAPEAECSPTYKKAQTSCESTSYCKLGTCLDSQEGTCAENTPQSVCENNGGVWNSESAEELGQCQLGCCAIGDQTAFVTQTRCKRLSSLYGLETNYRTDISTELQCIITSQPNVEGACVFTSEYERTCLRTTKSECHEFESSSDKEDVEFYEGTLCSDETLGTNCGPSKQTTCIKDDDAVHYLDTCGNLANIYDSSKIDDKEYWSTIYDKEDSCGYESLTGNANSKSCGNCDYYYGSTCKDYTVIDGSNRPDVGDNICADLGCTYEGEYYEHGETWCGTNSLFGLKSSDSEGINPYDLPGTGYYRYVCYNGEVTVEPCADYRQEICIENELEIEGSNDPFTVAGCVVNRWQGCVNQDNAEDCENSDLRDCTWVNETTYVGQEGNKTGYCTPTIAPGFDFWESDSSAVDTCGLASTTCTVTYEDKLLSKEKITSGAECLQDLWRSEQEGYCSSLGDCGYSQNSFGLDGYKYNSFIEGEKESA